MTSTNLVLPENFNDCMTTCFTKMATETRDFVISSIRIHFNELINSGQFNIEHYIEVINHLVAVLDGDDTQEGFQQFIKLVNDVNLLKQDQITQQQIISIVQSMFASSNLNISNNFVTQLVTNQDFVNQIKASTTIINSIIENLIIALNKTVGGGTLSIAASPSIVNTHFAISNVFDIQYGWNGNTLNASGFKIPHGSATLNAGDYFKFFESTTKPGTYGLAIYDSNNVQKQVLFNTGIFNGVSDSALLYSGYGQYGTLFTLTPYSYGGSGTFVLTQSPSNSVVNSYSWLTTNTSVTSDVNVNNINQFVSVLNQLINSQVVQINQNITTQVTQVRTDFSNQVNQVSNNFVEQVTQVNNNLSVVRNEINGTAESITNLRNELNRINVLINNYSTKDDLNNVRQEISAFNQLRSDFFKLQIDVNNLLLQVKSDSGFYSTIDISNNTSILNLSLQLNAATISITEINTKISQLSDFISKKDLAAACAAACEAFVVTLNGHSSANPSYATGLILPPPVIAVE